MKKDRNCGGGGMPYPVYPGMMNQGMMPMNPGIMPIPNMQMNPMTPNAFNTNNYMTQPEIYNNSLEQQVSNLTSQVNSLERRIISLESLVGSPTSKYNNSNYQVM